MRAIPVRNIYYLLCYAWNHIQQRDVVDAGAEDFTNVVDMLGHVLATSAAHLASRGLDRSYVGREEQVAGVRGKLNLARTIKESTLFSARVYCTYDEFEQDILANQIVKASIDLLARVQGLDREIQERLRAVHLRFGAISEISLRAEHFRRVQVHRNNRLYDFVLRVCRLVYDNVGVDERNGTTRFHDFLEDEATMGRVFEDFVFNFYRREQDQYIVSRPYINWYEATASETDLAHLPIMKTDVVLRSDDRALVLDTKYYAEALKGSWGGEKVRSGHLYQVFSYLQNLAPVSHTPVDGMLLYPAVRERFHLRYVLGGKRIDVATIDLSLEWRHIHHDLLGFV